MTYEEFMKKVDSIIASRLGGLTSSDLADTVFTMDRYYDDAEPEEVADEIMILPASGLSWEFNCKTFAEV